jgi:hypothetical protein
MLNDLTIRSARFNCRGDLCDLNGHTAVIPYGQIDLTSATHIRVRDIDLNDGLAKGDFIIPLVDCPTS